MPTPDRKQVSGSAKPIFIEAVIATKGMGPGSQEGPRGDRDPRS